MDNWFVNVSDDGTVFLFCRDSRKGDTYFTITSDADWRRALRAMSQPWA
jgi:hypothetical protein